MNTTFNKLSYDDRFTFTCSDVIYRKRGIHEYSLDTSLPRESQRITDVNTPVMPMPSSIHNLPKFDH